MKIEPRKHWQTAMQGYADELMALISQYPDANILELGGGRWPSFRLAEMPKNVAAYTVNDIDPNELAHNGPNTKRPASTSAAIPRRSRTRMTSSSRVSSPSMSQTELPCTATSSTCSSRAGRHST
nr:hypothetical protein [Sphingomonas daechungensis]